MPPSSPQTKPKSQRSPALAKLSRVKLSRVKLSRCHVPLPQAAAWRP